MKYYYYSFLFLLLLYYLLLADVGPVNGCVLCPLRIPARPKPLDQFRLPSIQKILNTAETITRLCHNGSRLDSVSESCRADVSHLFCSLKALVDNYKRECPSGSEDADMCASCRRETAQIHEKNSWILTWIDSIGKMPSGISDGNYHWLGDYEQCTRLKDDHYFNGRYCLLDFQVPDAVWNVECANNDPLEVYLGICLPAACTLGETREFLTILCTTVILIATLVEWYRDGSILPTDKKQSIFEQQKNTRQSLILALALQTNLRDALRTTNRHRDFHAVQGLQVVSVAFFIFGNLFFWIIPYLENVGYFYYLTEMAITQPIVNYSFHLDALLALGAMRLSRKSLNNEFSTLRRIFGYFRRFFIRFWPAYAFMIGFMALVYIRLGEGPMWSHNDLAERCTRAWLPNLLLVNNILGSTETCLDGGFLVALEAQFVIFAMLGFVVGNVVGFRKPVSYFFCLLMFASMLYTFAIAFAYRTAETLTPTSELATNPNKYSAFVDGIYLNPLARIAPFILGLSLPEHFRTSFLFSNPNFSTVFPAAMWILCSLIGFYVIWTPYLMPFYAVGEKLRFLSAIYAAAHRILWAFAVLFLAHLLNQSNPHNWLNAFLSWRIFHPLSKLVYLVFLVSEPVALSLFASLHRPIYATPLFTILTSIGTLVCSFIIALLIDILISRPINNLLTIIFAKRWNSSSAAASSSSFSKRHPRIIHRQAEDEAATISNDKNVSV